MVVTSLEETQLIRLMPLPELKRTSSWKVSSKGRQSNADDSSENEDRGAEASRKKIQTR